MEYGRYIIYIIVLILIGILYEKYKLHNIKEEDEKQYELVKRFLLNDSGIGKHNLPIIWIHASKEVNSRWWPSFHSRNTKCLNQPYQFITIKSVIDTCGKSFNVCLIDDNSFKKLIPDWNIDLDRLGEPIKSKFRELAFARLLYAYGGFRIPSSFLSTKNLISIYETTIKDDGIIIGELTNNSVSSEHYTYMVNPKFLGCKQGNNTINEYILYLEHMISNDYTADSVFTGEIENWWKNVDTNIIPSELLGVIDTDNKPVTVERLSQNSYISLHDHCYGVYIPEYKILNRTAFQWLARLSPAQILNSDTALGKILLVSSCQNL